MCFDPDVHPRRELLAALNTADGPRAFAAADEHTGSLQLVGDGLLLALEQSIEGADDRARHLAARLRERDWPGDFELAQELDRDADAKALTPLHVDLDELCDVLDQGHGVAAARIHFATGAIWTAATIENSLDAGIDISDLDHDDRWLPVNPEGSGEAFHDMGQFLQEISEPDLRQRIQRTLEGRGAFRRFRDALEHYPHLEDRWLGYRDDRRRGRARAWLAAHGYRAVAPPGR